MRNFLWLVLGFFRKLFGPAEKRRSRALLVPDAFERIIEVFEERCLLSTVTAVSSPVGYPTPITADPDAGAVVYLGPASSTVTLPVNFSQAGSGVYGDLLYVTGSKAVTGEPVAVTVNLTDSTVTNLALNGLGGSGDSSVSGVFKQEDGTILLGGFSSLNDPLLEDPLVFSYWDLDGTVHEAGDSNVDFSFSFAVSPLGRMIGVTAGAYASYVDVGIENSHQFLPDQDGYLSYPLDIYYDNTIIVGGAVDQFDNDEPRVWTLQTDGTYVRQETLFQSPNGENATLDTVQKLQGQLFLSGRYFNSNGDQEGGLWKSDGSLMLETGSGGANDSVKIGNNLVYAMSNGTDEDHLLIVDIVDSSFQTRSIPVSALGFPARTTLRSGSLAVAPNGDLIVMGTSPQGRITVKTFPVVKPTFSYEVDVTGDGLPELTGTSKDPFNGTWEFTHSGSQTIDVKMTSSTGEVYTATTTIVVAPRVIVGVPGRYTTDRTPNITWKQIPGMVKTEVWTNNGTTGVGHQVAAFVSHDTGSYTFSSLPEGDYSNWVRHQNADGVWGPWSAQADLGVKAQADAPTVSLNTREFSWTAVPGATRYFLWVNDAKGKNVLNVPNVQGTSYRFDLPMGQNYRVWVQPIADKSGGGTRTILGTWSPAKTFDIISVPPVIRSVTQNGLNTVVKWEAVADATLYDIWVDQLNPRVSEVKRFPSVASGQTSKTILLEIGSYAVWIRAKTDGVLSGWSVAKTFQVTLPQPPQVTVDVTGPKAVISFVPPQGTLRTYIWISKLNPYATAETKDDIPSTATSYTSNVGKGSYRVWILYFMEDGSKTPWSKPIDFVLQ